MSETFEQMALRVASAYGTNSINGADHIVAFATRIRDELVKWQAPFAYVTGQDCMENGFMDASAWQQGEFTTPLYLHPVPIPADMVLVPREPTEAMQSAFYLKFHDCWANFHAAYKAMIASFEGVEHE